MDVRRILAIACVAVGCISTPNRSQEPLASVDRSEAVAVVRPESTVPSSEPELPSSLVYSCRGFGPDEASPVAADANDPLSELAERLRELERGGSPSDQATTTAFARAAALAPASLSTAERILLQSVALRLARSLPTHRTEALALVDALALPANVLVALGDRPDPSAVARFLGPDHRFIDRRTVFCGSSILLHDRIFGGTLSFRPIRTPERRALLAQLVAFDTAHHAHVTPIVDTIEIRNGLSLDSPACIVELDVRRRRLARVPYDAVPHSMFVRKTGDGGLGCLSCHSTTSAFGLSDLTREEAGPLISGRKTRMLELADRMLAELTSRR